MSGVRLERTVTLGLIATVFLQTAGALIWVGAAEARIEQLEREVETSWAISERLARLEGETAVMAHTLRRIEEALHDAD
ncbi:hypothetical protein [uncultured Algimonas sp.]|uniref:hypothetical protein n=1 Tax=uncultured Algimonas sp. TaxID=1547920 RepID=UPI00260653BC|nr:hypothetical protein [uncultured Algimonas sp.]